MDSTEPQGVDAVTTGGEEEGDVPDSPLTRTAALAALGLPEGASTTEITRTFRRLAKRAHPDLADPTDPDAGRRFSALLEAYRTLTGESPGPQPQSPTSARPAPRRVPVRVRSAGTSAAGRPPIVAGPVRVSPPHWSKPVGPD
jgi:hypothetical protein